MTSKNTSTSDLNLSTIEWVAGDPLQSEWPKTLCEWWQNAALKLADHPVIVEHNVAWSWPDLLAVAQTIAATWDEVLPGERIVIIGPNSIAHLLAELAIWMRGAVAVPLSVSHANLQEIIDDVAPIWVLSDELFFFDCGCLCKPLQQLRHVDASQSFTPYPSETNDLALILFTSGSSGTPKGVMLSHGNMCSQQAAFALLWPEVGVDDSCVSYLPWHHSFGSLAERLWAIGRGCCLHIVPGGGRHFESLRKMLRSIRPSIFMSVPKIHHEVACGQLLDPQRVRWVFTAGAQLGQAAETAYAKSGIFVVEGWGLTEASPSLTVTRTGAPRLPGIVGFPIPGVRIGCSEAGEILAAGPGIMLGYWGDEPASKSVLYEDEQGQRILCCGDKGEMTSDGLRLRGRMDEALKHPNGEKVPVKSIEETIAHKLSELNEIQHIQIIIDERLRGVGLLLLSSASVKQSPLRQLLDEINDSLVVPWQRLVSFASIDISLLDHAVFETSSYKFSRSKVVDLWSGYPDRWHYIPLVGKDLDEGS